MTDLVSVPGNPSPELAEAVWYRDSNNRKCRAMFAPALSRFSKARGTVLVCPGRTEFIEKYFEVARDLQSRGFAVAVFDWPGQGLSARLLDDGRAGHIDSFETYAEAFRAALKAIGQRAPRPHVVLAHSMGGAIALEALRTGKVQADAAVFSAPMWGIRMPPLAGVIASVMCALGQTGKAVSAHKTGERFAENVVTHDEARWGVQQALIAANPALALGAVTWGWVRQALAVTRDFAGGRGLDEIDIPVLVASAEEDELVINAAHAAVTAKLPHARHIVIAGAKHEILMETDERRNAFFSAFDEFLRHADI